MTLVYLGLGSNLGDRRRLIASAVDALRGLPATSLLRLSSIHETEPVGGPPQEPYLNAVAELETEIEPRQLLRHLKAIERSLGRVPSERWGPRAIDLDILLYGQQQIREDDLIVPHPRLWDRPFVLQPLAEVAPALAAAGPTRWREVIGQAASSADKS